MLKQAKQVVATCVMALAVTAISLPAVSFSATAPVAVPLSNLALQSTPVRIAVDEATGYLYATATGTSPRVINRYDASGTQLLGTINTAAEVRGFAFAADGSLLVAQNTFVARYDVTTGKEIGRLTGGDLVRAYAVAVDDQTGYIYVTDPDPKSRQVLVYNASGQFVKAFGKEIGVDLNGVATPLLMSPTGIAFEKISRQFFVADGVRNRVQVFDVEGNFIKSIGIPISASTTSLPSGPVKAMQLVTPIAVAFEYSKGDVPQLNRIYIADTYLAVVHVIDPATYTELGFPGIGLHGSGTANGQLMCPSDIVLDSVNNRLLVADSGNGYVAQFSIDGGTSPAYVPVVAPPAVAVVIPASTTPVVTPPATPTADTVGPVLVVSAIADGSVTKDAIQNVTGTVSDVNAVTVLVNDLPAVLTENSFTVPVTLVAGINTITVKATDLAGNETVNVRNVNYDVAAPLITVLEPMDNSITNKTFIDVTGTVDEDATVTVAGIAAVVVNKTWSANVALNNGLNTVDVVATDIAGNISSQKRSITLDTIKPRLAISTPSHDTKIKRYDVKIKGAVKDTIAKNVTYTVEGVSNTASIVRGSFAFDLNFTKNGTYPIVVTVSDTAGNTASATRNIIVDVKSKR